MITLTSVEEKYGTKIRAIKSDLHRHPELSMQEIYTTGLIREQLSSMEIEIIDFGLETGVVGLIRGGKQGPVIALRADMDALPITENTNDLDASLEEGKMHACGHDVHTAALLGTAMLLNEGREHMNGNVVFVFQPAEEITRGAKKIIEAGLFERISIDAMFGLHVCPEIETGNVGIKTGPFMAAKDSFQITISGKGGHGSVPQDTSDPIVAGAALIGAIQSITSRNIDPREAVVLSVCSIHAGAADNVTPDTLTMSGSIRTFSSEMREFIIKRLEEVAGFTARTYDCMAEVIILHDSSTPVLINDTLLAKIANESATQLLGNECLSEQKKVLSSEDFAEYGESVPVFFYFLGSRTPGHDYYPLHNPQFHADERTPVIGAALLASTVLHAMDRIEKC